MKKWWSLSSFPNQLTCDVISNASLTLKENASNAKWYRTIRPLDYCQHFYNNLQLCISHILLKHICSFSSFAKYFNLVARKIPVQNSPARNIHHACQSHIWANFSIHWFQNHQINSWQCNSLMICVVQNLLNDVWMKHCSGPFFFLFSPCSAKFSFPWRQSASLKVH